MKTYAISTALFRDSSLDEVLARIAEAGFREVELSGEDDDLDKWMSNVQEVRRALDSAGIVARALHSPPRGWDNGAPDEAARRMSVEAAAASFLFAAEVGAEIVVCHPNKPTHPFAREDFAENWALSLESLAILAGRAHEAGVKMAVENMPARGQPRPGGTVADIVEMINGLGDHVGICQDAGHSNANRISAANEALQAGNKLFTLHIQDNDGNGQDQHLLPGRGTTDWDAFLDALDKTAFRGMRTFEVLRGDEVEILLAEVARLRRLWEAR